jgi:hypothetical protein
VPHVFGPSRTAGLLIFFIGTSGRIAVFYGP